MTYMILESIHETEIIHTFTAVYSLSPTSKVLQPIKIYIATINFPMYTILINNKNIYHITSKTKSEHMVGAISTSIWGKAGYDISIKQ